MTYKDPDKQREANRQAKMRQRVKMAAIEGQFQSQGMTAADNVIPERKPKRGKDIKCFADLPPDVQENINRTSDSEQERKLRTACAIHYQNMSPDRFNSTGVAV